MMNVELEAIKESGKADPILIKKNILITLIVECLAPGDQKQLLGEARKAREFLEALVG